MRTRDDRSAVFGRYQIFPELRVLLRDGEKIDLGPRAFDVLWMLVEANGKVLSKDELIAHVWGAPSSKRIICKRKCPPSAVRWVRTAT